MIGGIVYRRLELQRRIVLWSSLEQDTIGDKYYGLGLSRTTAETRTMVYVRAGYQ